MKDNLALIGTDNGKLILLNFDKGLFNIVKENNDKKIIACRLSNDAEKAISVHENKIICMWKITAKTLKLDRENCISTSYEIKDASFYDNDNKSIVVCFVNGYVDSVKRYNLVPFNTSNSNVNVIFKKMGFRIHNIILCDNNEVKYALFHTRERGFPNVMRDKLTHCQNMVTGKESQNLEFDITNYKIGKIIEYMRISRDGEYSAFVTKDNNTTNLILNVSSSRTSIYLDFNILKNSFCFSNDGQFIIAVIKEDQNYKKDQIVNCFKIKFWDLHEKKNIGLHPKTINVKAFCEDDWTLFSNITYICCSIKDDYLLLGTANETIQKINISSIIKREEQLSDIFTVASAKTNNLLLLEDVNYILTKKRTISKIYDLNENIERIFKESSILKHEKKYEEACEKLLFIIEKYPKINTYYMDAKNELKLIQSNHGIKI